MSYENASITWGGNQLAAMVASGKIIFESVVQRSYVWEKSRASKFIESLMLSVPIPPTYAKRYDDGTGKRGGNKYDILDGQQRLTTIKRFIKDEFELTTLPPVTYYNELTDEEETVDVSGLKFSELPEGLQEKVKNARISVIYFDNLSKQEEKELFKRLNNGKPLSTKSRTLASCRDIEGLLDIGSHKLFQSVDGMMTEKARANKNQVALVMKCWCMMNQSIEDVSFESKIFNPLMEKTEVTETEKLAMIEVFDLIFDTHFNLVERKEKAVAKKLFTETHMVSLIPFFKKAIENGIDENLMADWLVDFFTSDDGASVNKSYNDACSGSAKNASIIARNDALSDSFAAFFNVEDEQVEDAEEDNGENGLDADEVNEDANEEDETPDMHSLVDEILDDLNNPEREDE